MLVSKIRIAVVVLLFFIPVSYASAQSADPDLVKDYYESVSEGKRLEAELLKIEQRLTAYQVAQRTKFTIPPANSSGDVKAATVRVVRPDMHPFDTGNLRYGTTFVFSCVSNDKGSFTAYGLTAAHVLHRPESNFIDTGGAYNVNAKNTEKTGVLSYGYRVLAEMGKDFEIRPQDDPLMRDSAVIAFDVAACPKAVISIKSFIAPGEHVTPTGFPYTSPGRVQTQSPKCSMISSGSAQPCKIDGDVVKGYSGGPITADDGQAIGITSAGGNGLILSDSAVVIRSMLDSLCRAKPPKIPYYYVDKKRIDCAV